MIFLFLLCLVRVESAADLHSVGVDEVTKSHVVGISKTSARTRSDASFNELSYNQLRAESILRRLARSAEQNRDESHAKWTHLSHLRRLAQELLDSAWVRPPILKYLTTVVIPGAVINHGKLADLGHLSLIAVTHERLHGGNFCTNMTISHGNLKTAYKYNLDGPKGRLEMRAPNRVYSVKLSSKQEGSQCVTEIDGLALETEDEMEFSSNGESSEELAPHMKFVEHVLTLESRRTAFYNIQAAIQRKLQTVKPPFCKEIE